MPTNETLLENTELCTLETCPLSLGMVQYLPLLWCQILFMAIFGAAIIPQLGFGIRYKTWTFMVAMVLGLIGEVVGYGGRIALNKNPFKLDGFLMYSPRQKSPYESDASRSNASPSLTSKKYATSTKASGAFKQRSYTE
ncbi:hypothetical protein BDV09DRAFT_200700 [Aspergillus tetrazonus]